MAPTIVKLLEPEFPRVQLTMIGPDKGDGSLERTQWSAKELGVSRRIDYPGGLPKSEIPAILNQYDVFLNTTDVDNTPVSVVEALACGLCIVSTNVGESRTCSRTGATHSWSRVATRTPWPQHCVGS